ELHHVRAAQGHRPALSSDHARCLQGTLEDDRLQSLQVDQRSARGQAVLDGRYLHRAGCLSLCDDALGRPRRHRYRAMAEPEGVQRARRGAAEGPGSDQGGGPAFVICLGRGVLIAAAFAAILASPRASAEGALAIGSSGDIAKDGIAYGYSNDVEKADAAAEKALA